MTDLINYILGSVVSILDRIRQAFGTAD